MDSQSLGSLVLPDQELSFPRGIRADRDAVRTFIQWDGVPIKLEFVHFDYYGLRQDKRTQLFPVPFIDQSSCFLTKLLANADRYADANKKDIFDLCMMSHHWGGIPDDAWSQAEEKYGLRPVYEGLVKALDEMNSHKTIFKDLAITSLDIAPDVAEKILDEYAPALLRIVQQRV